MYLNRILTTTAALALLAGAAQAQTATKAAKAPAAAESTAKSTTATPAPAATSDVAAASATKVVAAGDIVATAKASGQFTTFLKAAEATNLTTLLKDNKNLTVFAPTDAAFAALPAGELDKLMLPENKAQLQKVLIYHVINAKVPSSEFKGATRKAATVAGPSVELSGGARLKVNDADIVQADIMATNGIIHVVDKVLMPPGAMAAANTAVPASATAPAMSSSPAPAKEPTTLPATQVLPKKN
ncbi:fasciclin domain-containing protein [Phenylobacterium sp. 20VBR1]|uniref:Fasciclin domain-containing protein n=1 Tax=Phenylobacterium glaciei TaxID=2803784 RepID=A0A941HWR2_9CAUL|nr:fasciclin domain-containing protein [Phenylobacterium glaciei]MBR7619517.1 fasciclin domain-containing protein [Phenylobacterium glaciei]QQZ51841.1 fasciclin domain-containing protein [Phenylobacterium glaciei]